MAGNFWQSSHYEEWILDKHDLLSRRNADLQLITEEEYTKVMCFFANFVQALGEGLKVRQQVIATATVYFKRFYSRNSFRCIDPFLMTPTCLHLASKVEEFGPISNNKLMTLTTTMLKTRFSYAYKQEYPYRIVNLLECEFFLLEMMDCCLIVYQPYRPLTEYCSKLNEDGILPLSWRIVNDSLRTDVSLLCPPYMIALSAMYMACIIQNKVDCQKWFAELNVDFDRILEITQSVMSLYDLFKEGYDERKDIFDVLEKLPKPKTNPNTNRS